jgi:hypothetical protein
VLHGASWSSIALVENQKSCRSRRFGHWRSGTFGSIHSRSDRWRAIDFAIPYEFHGVAHLFLPDFLVRLKSGVTLIIEVKGFVSEQDKAKFQAAKRWVSAVNNWGRMGQWAFHAAKDPNQLGKELAYITTTAQHNVNVKGGRITLSSIAAE